MQDVAVCCRRIGRRLSVAPRPVAGILVAVAGLISFWAGPGIAQQALVQIQEAVPAQPAAVQVQAAPVQIIAGGAQAAPDGEQQGPSSLGPILETDSDVDLLLSKATDFQRQHQHREALMVLEHILEQYPQKLTTVDGRVYRPARRAVHELVMRDRQTLDQYRLLVDGRVRGLLGGPAERCVDRAALENVVDFHFPASEGDEAAVRLAGLMMDEHRFHEARQLLRLVLGHYPDPSIRRGDLQARLAACEARLSYGQLADQAIRAAAGDSSADPHLLAAAKQIVADAAQRRRPINATGQVAGPMERLGRAGLSHDDRNLWFRTWTQAFDLEVEQLPGLRVHQNNRGATSRAQLSARWAEHAWRPTGRIVPIGERGYLRSNKGLICIDTRSGRVLWNKPDGEKEPAVRSRITTSFHVSVHSGDMPANPMEVSLFSDQMSKAVAVIDGQVYCIERSIPFYAAPHLHRQLRMLKARGQQFLTGSALVARDAKSGRLLWRRGRTGKANDPLGDVRFVSMPIACEDHLVLAYQDDQDLYLAAIEPSDGSVIWRKYLCSLSTDAMFVREVVGITAQGPQVYLASGQGAVFAIDGRTGQLDWAARYAREVADANWSRHLGWMQNRPTPYHGWDENNLLIVAGQLLVMPADAPRLIRLDPVTGNPFEPIDLDQPQYALADQGARLTVATADQLICYEVSPVDGGRPRIVWKAPVDAMTGRAVLTQSALFVPQQKQVITIDPQTGKRLAVIDCQTPFNDPVGNLFTDGRQLLAYGMERVYGLVDAQLQLEVLNQAIAREHEPADRLLRGRIRLALGAGEQGADDLRVAVAKLTDHEQRRHARQLLLDHLLRRVATGPADSPALLEEADALAVGAKQRLRVDLARVDWLIAQDQAVDAAELCLDLAEAPTTELVSIGRGDQKLDHLGAVAAAARLKGLADRQPAAVGPLVQRRADALFDQALTLDPLDQQQRLVDLVERFTGTDASLKALDRLLDQGEADVALAFAQREQLLERLSFNEDRSMAAYAMVNLAREYEAQGLDRQAWSTWTRVAEQFAGVPLAQAAKHAHFPPGDPDAATADPVIDPARVGQAEAVDPANAPDADAGQLGESGSLADLIDQPSPPPPPMADELARDRLVELVGSRRGEPDPARMPAPPYRLAWNGKGSNQFLLDDTDGSTRQFLSENLVIHDRAKSQLTCRPIDQPSKVRWTIRLPNNRWTSQYSRSVNVLEHTIDGHVFYTIDNRRITAHSLLDGRSLWEAPIDPAVIDQLEDPRLMARLTRGRAPLAVGQGVVVTSGVADGMFEQVRVYDAVSRGRLLWQRQFPTASVEGLVIAGDRLIIVCRQSGYRSVVCDLMTGQQLGRFNLPDLNLNAPMIWSDDALLCHDNRGTLFCHDLPTGKQRWRREHVRYQSTKQLSADVVYLMDNQGDSVLTRPGDGHILARIDSKQTEGQPTDVALTPDRKQLYALSRVSRDGVATTVLSVVDVQTTERIRTIELGPQYGAAIEAQTLAAAGDYLPWPRQQQREKQRGFTGQVELMVYGAHDGEPVQEEPIPGPNRKGLFSHVTQPAVIRGGRLVMVTNERISLVEHDDGQPVSDEEPATANPPPDDQATRNMRQILAQFDQALQSQTQRLAELDEAIATARQAGDKKQVASLSVRRAALARQVDDSRERRQELQAMLERFIEDRSN